MAYGIDELRKQNLFDQYGMMSMPMMGGGYNDSPDSGQFGGSPYRNPPRPVGPEPIPDPMQPTGPFNPDILGPDIRMGPPSSLQAPRTYEDHTAQDIQEIFDAINKIYTPQTTDRDRLRNLLDNVPQREEPSLARRFVAAGVGLGNRARNIPGGIGEQEKVLYAPYLRDMAEWKEKAAPFQQAAGSENTANINERTLTGNVVNAISSGNRADRLAQTAYDRNQTLQQKYENDYKLGQEKNAIAWAVQHGATAETKGEYVILTYKDGRMPVNTGVKTTNFSPTELANINNAADMAQVLAKGEQDRQTQAALPKNAEANEQDRIDKYYTLHPADQDLFVIRNGHAVPKKAPVVNDSWLPFGINDTSQEEVDRYYQVMKPLFPDMVVPPRTAPTTSGMHESPNPSVQTPTPPGGRVNQGLGPQTSPPPPTAFGNTGVVPTFGNGGQAPMTQQAQDEADLNSGRAMEGFDPVSGKHFVVQVDDKAMAAARRAYPQMQFKFRNAGK